MPWCRGIGAWVVACSVAVMGALAPIAGGQSVAAAADGVAVDRCQPRTPEAPSPDWTELSDAEIATWIEWGGADEVSVKAWRLLGERFVAAWRARLAGDDELGRVVVGVHNLQDSEVESLKELLRPLSGGPVEVANRSFSRAEFTDFRKKVWNTIEATGGWSSHGTRDHAGLVEVMVLEECMGKVRDALVAATGRAPIEGADATAALKAVGHLNPLPQIEGWTAADGKPAVVLYPGEVTAALDYATAVMPLPGVPTTDDMKKSPRVSSTAKISGHARVKTSAKATVKVKVTVPGTAKPTGKVVVSWGKNAKSLKASKTVRVKKSARGTVTVRLPKLAKGTYVVTARFTPTDSSVTASIASKLKLRVI
jgi:hypothetical protein